ncbi:hypothetical protein AVEN_93575-1 [Araneus ventricosus]|uniref:Mariner Mos1 transposase n=1 Tax=Araneus ventricosus TaxID=182803 RepID=A0A4Y2APS6_ARAVE|nr:hypothetical protein AVEN_93575-1 [Araneus ventricosus]
MQRELGYREVSAQWVPPHLRNEQEDGRMGIFLEHLIRHHKDGTAFLVLIVVMVSPFQTGNKKRFDRYEDIRCHRAQGRSTHLLLLGWKMEAPHCQSNKIYSVCFPLGSVESPPYSPDLSPYDYHVFCPVNKALKRQVF